MFNVSHPTSKEAYLYYADGVIPRQVNKSWDDQIRSSRDDILRDFTAIHASRFDRVSPAGANEQKLYVATAGAPASGKSTEFDLELDHVNKHTRTGSDPRYTDAVKIDPDRYTMPYMSVYQDAMSAGRKGTLGQRVASVEAYNLARPASNSYANRFLNQAVSEGYHVAHGTTGTSPFYKFLLDKLANQGYERRLFLFGASESMREESAERREKLEGFFQVSDEDFVSKGNLFTERQLDLFGHSDEIILCWKDSVDTRAEQAADYHDGKRHVKSQSAFNAYVEDYQSRRHELETAGKDVVSWDNVERAFLENGSNLRDGMRQAGA